MCRVSVIIPTYNRARMLRQAIRSVLAQTYRNFEVIVVDDGSTDDTREIVAAIDDPRVRYVWQENQERSAARNNGVSQSTGELLAFLDSDDVILPHKLALHVEMLDRYPEAVLVYGSDVNMDDENRLLNPFDLLHISDEPVVRDCSDDLARGCSLSTISVLLRRKAFEEAGGFDLRLSHAEDWDLWVRVSELGPFCTVRSPVSAVRAHASRSIHESANMLNGRLAVIEKTSARRGASFNSEAKTMAELDVYASCAARAALLDASEASNWIKAALARSVAPSSKDALRRAFVGCAASTAYSLQDCRSSARWLAHSVRMINSLGGSESRQTWLGLFWGAAIQAARGVGDDRLAVQAFARLVTSGGTGAVDRGVIIDAVRSLIAFGKHPRAKRRMMPRESEIAAFLEGLRDEVPPLVAAESTGAQR